LSNMSRPIPTDGNTGSSRSAQENAPLDAHVQDSYKPLANGVHEDLPAILLAKHNELDRLLDELNEISSALKSKDSPDIQGLSESLMRAVRSAVRQSLLDKELCSLALIDDLTGLHNRRGFLALAGQQLKHGHRSLQELLLFSIDVDNLKTINDSFGHQEGDTALLRTANAMRRTFRNSDILARFGGDEFCALAPEASIVNERNIIERLKENLKHVSTDESRYPLAVSIGTARFNPRSPVMLEQLMDDADQAMYRAKRSKSSRAIATAQISG
jgi:two-component system cell cycle response regulator